MAGPLMAAMIGLPRLTAMGTSGLPSRSSAGEPRRRSPSSPSSSDQRLMEEAMALAEEIAANPGDAVWAAKRLIHENAVEGDLRRVVTQEGYSIHEMRGLPDHVEAVRAFMEKREPRFNA